MSAPGWPFGDLRPFQFDFIMADPPPPFVTWSEKGAGKSPQAHYETMPLEAIAALPVGHLVKDHSVLMLWATWPLFPEYIGFVKKWGFRYVTGGAWRKTTVNGKDAFGPGYVLRNSCDPYIIAFTGEPKTNGKSLRNLITGQRREHSRKPETAYPWAERLMPDAYRLDLFSRQRRPGWVAFGDQLDHFTAPTEEPAA